MIRRSLGVWLLLALVSLAGCLMPGVGPGVSSKLPPISSEDGMPVAADGGIVANNAGKLSGSVTGPSYLISNNVGGLISNNVGGYHTLALALVPVQKAVVYLTSPNEQFYAGSNGDALFTFTDELGHYAFNLAPVEVPVVVTVLLPKNRRLVGFLMARKGENHLDVDLASTVVTEFLRDQARLSHRTFASYQALSTELPEILRLTRSLIEDGSLSFRQHADDPDGTLDLSVNGIAAMRHAYVRAFAATNKPLSDAWKRLLGYRPLLIDEVEVGLPSDMKAIAITAGSGSVYVAALNFVDLMITQTSASGSRRVAKVSRAKGVDYIGGMAISGEHLFVGAARAGQLELDPAVQSDVDYFFDVSWDASGSPLMVPAPNLIGLNNSAPEVDSFSAFDLDVHGNQLYVASDLTNEIFRYGLDSQRSAAGLERLAGVPLASPSELFFSGDARVPGIELRLNKPSALTYHEEGGKPYLYVADTLNHRIRRIDLNTPGFPTETVLGRGTIPYGNMLMPPGPAEDGKTSSSQPIDLDNPEGIPKDLASLNFPHKMVFDAAGRMFFADSDHRRVRMFDGTKVYTLAGTDPGAPLISGDSRRSGLGEISSLAFDSNGDLLLADARSNKLRRLRLQFGL